MTTTIPVSEETRDRLFRRKESPNDTYDEIIVELLDSTEGEK